MARGPCELKVNLGVLTNLKSKNGNLLVIDANFLTLAQLQIERNIKAAIIKAKSTE